MAVKTKLALGVAIILGTASAAPAASPYGGPDEVQQCLARMAASGPGDLEEMAMTEFDVMVGRCMSLINRPRPPGRQPR